MNTHQSNAKRQNKIGKVHLFVSVLFLVLLSGFSSLLQAQSGHVAENTKNTPDQALRSNARVNPSTLAMELSIPIANFPGRGGLTMPLVFNYSSKLWRFELSGYGETESIKFTTNIPRYSEKSASGWTSSFGTAQIEAVPDTYDCSGNPLGEAMNHVPPLIIPPGGEPPPGYCGLGVYYINRVRVKLPDGSAVELRKDDVLHNFDTEYSSLTGTFLATDGSRSRLELGSTSSIFYLADGSRYYFQIPSGGTEQSGYMYEDRNGNRLNFNVSTRTWTDTLGRSLTSPIPLNLGSQEQTAGTQNFTMPGLTTGSSRQYSLAWKNLGDSGVLLDPNESLFYPGNRECPYGSLQNSDALFIGSPETRICRGAQFNPVVLTEIVLPNGAKYKFQYNHFGEITKIEYPTGASERFEYGQVPTLAYKRDFIQDRSNRGVINRWVKESGGATELQWKYEAVKQTNGLKIKTTAPDNQTITEQIVESNWANLHTPPRTMFGFDNPAAGRAFEERVYSGTTLKNRRLTEYEYTGAVGTGAWQNATRDPRTKREISVIFEPDEAYALVTMTSNTYDVSGSSDAKMFSHLNLKTSEQYNYIAVAASTAASETVTQLAARFNGITAAVKTEIDYSYDTNYVNSTKSILGRVTEQRVINPATSAVVSKTQTRYDEYSLISSGTLPTYASPTWQSPASAYLGNVTSVRNYSDVAANQYVETHGYFDQYGNLRKSVDANGNESQVEYDATAYACAYPTKTYSPVPDATGTYGSNTALTAEMTYDFNTGLHLTSKDANSQTTTMLYADSLLRSTKVIAPNGHETITEYGTPDSGGQLPAAERFVKVKSQIDATNWKQGYTWFDGLARTIKTQSVDSNGDIFTETEYDILSRPYRATNPYRTGETKHWTETAFDAFGRAWKVTTPDGACVETIYGLATSGSQIGTVETVIDEAGKKLRTIEDSSDNLIRVDEPDSNNDLGSISTPSQATVYTYDVLDNLTQIVQGGQIRSFAYDSLKRLKQATNPESGTFQYSYDPNGNLVTKIDARGISTTYTYDALNRVVLRNYSGSTPDVSYFYDNPQVSNSKGELTKISSSVSETLYTSFDARGEVLGSQQITDGQTYTFGYTYNLGGDLLTQTYPSGKVVAFDYDSNGELSQVKKQQVQIEKIYANSFSYTPHGQVEKLRLGNGKWETTKFNSTLQVTEIGLGHSSTDTGVWKVNYEFGDWENGAINPVKNNGNLARQTFIVPTIGQVTGFTAVQIYNYDSLDRLKSATETVGGVEKWKQTFDYDRFGNKRFNTANTTLISSETNVPKVANPEILTTNNQYKADQDDDGLNDYLYDTSGNLTKDAQSRTFTYDGENRQLTAAGNNLSVSYSYDGNDKRVKSYNAITNQTTIFVYESGGNLTAEYTINVPAPTNPTISYTTDDALGSPRVVTNSYGEVKSRRDFLPFGEELYAGVGNRTSNQKYSANEDNTRQKFTGYQRDAETNLDYAQSRYYSAMFGRFTSPDEFKGGPDELFDFEDDASSNPTFYADLENPQSLNKYQYTYNNPYKYTDEDGHCPICVVVAVVAVAMLTGADTVNAPGPGDPVYRNERGNNVFLNLIPMPGLRFVPKGLRNTVTKTRSVTNQVKNRATSQVKGSSTKTKGAQNPNVAKAITKGKQKHKEFANKVKQKKGWKSEPTLKDPQTGKIVRPDAVTKNGKPVELKPKTPSGIKKGKQQLPKQERATGKKGRVVYYD